MEALDSDNRTLLFALGIYSRTHLLVSEQAMMEHTYGVSKKYSPVYHVQGRPGGPSAWCRRTIFLIVGGIPSNKIQAAYPYRRLCFDCWDRLIEEAKADEASVPTH